MKKGVYLPILYKLQKMKKAMTFCAVLFAVAANALAQSVFTPSTDDPLFCDIYQLSMEKLVEGNRYYYLCEPTFDSPYALSLRDDTLVYVTIKGSINDVWRSNNKDKRRYELPLSHEESLAIINLIDEATMTANFFEEFIGSDGTYYTLCNLNRKVGVWSPREESRTYRTVRVMDSLCYAAKRANRKVLLRQLEECRALTYEFKQLYPLSYFKTCVCDVSIYSSGVESEKLVLESKYILGVELPVADEDKDTFEETVAALEDSVALWSREIFLQDKINRVSIIVSDTTAARCQVYYYDEIHNTYKALLIIPKERLFRNVVLSAANLKGGHYYYLLNSDNTWQAVRKEAFLWWPDLIDYAICLCF